MGSYENGIETKKRILAACRKLFYQKGYDDTTFKDICAEAQVNQSSIHYHFKTKDAILWIIYEETVEKNGREVERYSRADTLPFAKFLFSADLYLYKMLRDPKYLRLNLDASRLLTAAKFEEHIRALARNFFGHDQDYVALTQDAFYTLMAVTGFDESVLVYLKDHAASCRFEDVSARCAEMYHRIMHIGEEEYHTATEQVRDIRARVDWEGLDTTFEM